jgi:hypothetical protein
VITADRLLDLRAFWAEATGGDDQPEYRLVTTPWGGPVFPWEDVTRWSVEVSDPYGAVFHCVYAAEELVMALQELCRLVIHGTDPEAWGYLIEAQVLGL